MEERYVRCRRCHGVFESGVANCPRCGAEYVAIEAPLPSSEGSYEEKYKGSEFVAPVEAPQVLPRQQGSRYGLLLGAGAVLTVGALVIGMLFMSGMIGTPGPTPDSGIVYPITPRPSPSPTMPPIIDDALRLIANPDFNGHISIRTTISVAAGANNGKAVAQTVNVEADMAEGQTSGTVQMGSTRYEFRLVDGVFYQRALPNGTWVVKSAIPPFLLLSPLFAITDMKQIAYDGATAQHGAAHEIRSTAWYMPDPLKITGVDMSNYTVKVQYEELNLFIDNEGNPLYAEFHAWKDASDGTHLINIVTSYTFTDLSQVTPGGTPGASPTK
jgi:hypothetical protein